jgi:hypothetical protein
MTIGTTPMSKVETPLSLFLVENVIAEHASHVLAEIETKAERILGSFRMKEHDALRMAKIPNGGHLNHVHEQMGVITLPDPFLAPKPPRRLPRNEKLKCQRNRLQNGEGWS